MPTVGGAGEGVCSDSLPWRVHQRRAGYEDQPDGGQGAGESRVAGIYKHKQ